jgi:hypothetical protein
MATKKNNDMYFQVQRKACRTCIYRKETHFDVAKLEAQIADKHLQGFFAGYRVCHHSKDVCCAGFWRRHRWKFALGQIAQRLGFVQYVTVDTLRRESDA